MELIYYIVTVLQAFAISLGVGASTLSVIHFFAAISDGKIDETERRMMGIGYIILRVAMVVILLTTFLQAIVTTMAVGTSYFTPLTIMLWIIISVLFVNAVLMTIRFMPSTFGPAIQAGSWYTLGLIEALISVRITDFALWQWLLLHIVMITLGVAIINATMTYLKSHASTSSDA